MVFIFLFIVLLMVVVVFLLPMLLFYIVCCLFDLVSCRGFLVVKLVLPNVDLHSNN